MRPPLRLRHRLSSPTPRELLPAEVRDDLDAAADCDTHAGELLEAEEYLAAAGELGRADLWRVLAVASLIRWAKPAVERRCYRCGEPSWWRARCSCGSVPLRVVDMVG